MALTLGDRVLDRGLDVLRTEANQIWVLSSSPADYAAATAAKLGTATAAFGTVTNASGSRRIANPAITSGTVTAVGAASHWAAVDTVNSRLLATDTLSGGVTTNLSLAWTLGEIAVLRAPALSVSPPLLADAQAYVDQQRGMFITWTMATYAGTEFIDPTLFPPSSFNPTGLNIPQWAQVAKDFNCKYAVLTIKHKDGFTLWPTTTTTRGLANSPWYAANSNLDIAQAYVDAFRAAGVKPYFYFSIKDDYWLITHPGWTNAEFKPFTEAQMTEVLTRYGQTGAIWLDASFAHMGDASPWASATERNAFIKSVAPGIIIIDNCDLNSRTVTDIVEYESTVPPGGNVIPCETCFSIGGPTRWFWKADDQPNADASSIASTITNTNARNGTALVGISPNAVGVVPQAFIDRLDQVRLVIGDVPRVSPNNMTANSTPSPFVASASSEYSGAYQAYNCFNSSLNWYWAGSGALPQWVQIDLGSSKAASKYMMTTRPDNATHQFLGWTLEGSNNGSTWTTADTRTKALGAGAEVTFYTMTSPGTYRYWRWTFTSSQSGITADCANLALWA